MMTITVKSGNKLSVNIGSKNSKTVDAVGQRIVVGEIDPYTGDYEVTPEAEKETILPTNGLRMMDDVTVHKVPIYETSNISGTTVYIGRILDGEQ